MFDTANNRRAGSSEPPGLAAPQARVPFAKVSGVRVAACVTA